MNALALDEVIPPDAYAESRELHFDEHYRYVDRYRRIRIGPSVALVFENRHTLWFRVQELLRVARITDPSRVQAELRWYNRLLPRRNQLQAALWIAEPGRRPNGSLDAVRRGVASGRIGFRSDDWEIPGFLLTNRVGDRLIGLAHWLEFHFTPADREAFWDPTRRWSLFVESSEYSHESLPIEDEVYDSLHGDLQESDRD